MSPNEPPTPSDPDWVDAIVQRALKRAQDDEPGGSDDPSTAAPADPASSPSTPGRAPTDRQGEAAGAGPGRPSHTAPESARPAQPRPGETGSRPARPTEAPPTGSRPARPTEAPPTGSRPARPTQPPPTSGTRPAEAPLTGARPARPAQPPPTGADTTRPVRRPPVGADQTGPQRRPARLDPSKTLAAVGADLGRDTRPDPFPDSDYLAKSEQADVEIELEHDDGTVTSRSRTFLEWGAVILGALAVALLIKTFLMQAYYIPSESMEPTLKPNDRVLVNKVSYEWGDIGRGDIVVFHRPDNWGGSEEDLIKRAIAFGGETIDFRENQVFIDGDLLREPYLDGEVVTVAGSLSHCAANPTPTSCTVPDDHVFVLGDNRQNSNDSRFQGPVPRDDVVGRAFLRVWPLGDIGGL